MIDICSARVPSNHPWQLFGTEQYAHVQHPLLVCDWELLLHVLACNEDSSLFTTAIPLLNEASNLVIIPFPDIHGAPQY